MKIVAIITYLLGLFSPVLCWRFSNIRYQSNAWDGGERAAEFNLYRTRTLCTGVSGKGSGRQCVTREMPLPITCAWGIYPLKYNKNESWHGCGQSHLAPEGEVDIPEWGQQLLKWRVRSVHEHSNFVVPTITQFTNVTIEVVQAIPQVLQDPVTGRSFLKRFDVYIANVTLQSTAADCSFDSTEEGKMSYRCQQKGNGTRLDYKYKCGTKPPAAWFAGEELGVECNIKILPPAPLPFEYDTFVEQYWEPTLVWRKA